MSDPHLRRRVFMKAFGQNQQLLDFYIKLYDEAVAAGSTIPDVVAWIKFREVYIETPGGWTKREEHSD